MRFDQTEMYYETLSLSISMKDLNFTYDNTMFRMFRNYMEADIDKFFNYTRYNFHNQFIDTFDSISTNQVIQIVIEMGLLLLAGMLVTYKIFIFFNRIKETMETIFQFDNSELKVIKNYWINLFVIYQIYKER
jgi:hypothetical protein